MAPLMLQSKKVHSKAGRLKVRSGCIHGFSEHRRRPRQQVALAQIDLVQLQPSMGSCRMLATRVSAVMLMICEPASFRDGRASFSRPSRHIVRPVFVRSVS